MLTETKLKSIKPTDKKYKISDRDGLYVAVSKTGAISFRYDYRINGRRETITFGKYGEMSLAEARDKLISAKKMLSEGVSPAKEKQRLKQFRNNDVFGYWLEKWFNDANYANSTRDIVGGIINRDVKPKFGKLLLSEITATILRQYCEKLKERAPVTAVKTRDIVSMVFTYAKARGAIYDNPAEYVKGSSIATFAPRDRALTKQEIGMFFSTLKISQTSLQLKIALKLIMLTMTRKSAIVGATWDEIDFKNAEWTIPAERMKASRQGAGRPHIVYLSKQALDLFLQLKILSSESPYVLPSFGQSKYGNISKSSLNRACTHTIQLAQKNGLKLNDFTVHDMRRTASTHLHEAGYNSDWIEKALAHEQRGVRSVYNKAEYSEQRKKLLQDWADMIDKWVNEFEAG